MRVHLERDFMRQRFRVWFFETAGARSIIWRIRDGEWVREDHDPSVEEDEPSFVIPEDALEALIRASEGYVHAQDATVRHLDDAIATRDRLLTLVERPPAGA